MPVGYSLIRLVAALAKEWRSMKQRRFYNHMTAFLTCFLGSRFSFEVLGLGASISKDRFSRISVIPL